MFSLSSDYQLLTLRMRQMRGLVGTTGICVFIESTSGTLLIGHCFDIVWRFIRIIEDADVHVISYFRMYLGLPILVDGIMKCSFSLRLPSGSTSTEDRRHQLYALPPRDVQTRQFHFVVPRMSAWILHSGSWRVTVPDLSSWLLLPIG